MKTSGWTKFLALCLALISLSMLVAGGLGIRAANKEHLKDESELQDLRSRMDEYREVSAALMDRASYEQLNRTLDEKQKKYSTDTAKHRADLSTYTATNSGLEMGTAALNQAESALETGRTQYEMGRKALKASLNAFAQIDAVLGPIQAQSGTIRELLSLAKKMLRGEEADPADPHDGSVYKLQQAVRKLTALIENELPEPLPAEMPPAETPPAETPPAETPPTETPPTETPPTETPPTETPPTETPPAETPPTETPPTETPPAETPPMETPPAETPPTETPPEETPPEETPPTENPPAENPPAPSDDPPPGTDPADTPRSPDTGEEPDLSARLNAAIREVIAAAAVVEEDAAAITAKAESLELPPEILQTVLSSAGTVDTESLRRMLIDGIHGSGIVLTPEQGSALGQMLEFLEASDDLTRAAAEQLAQLSQAADVLDQESDEMADFLLEALETAAAGLENAGEGQETADLTFTEDQLRFIRSAWLSNKEAIETELSSTEAARKDGYGLVVRAESTAERVFTLVGQLSGARATLDETWAAMKEMGAQLEEGEAALAEGRAKLDAAKDEQKKKAEELDKKKRDLDAQEKALKQSSELAEEQKELEEREKTLRAALQSREEIRRRSEAGEELLSASEGWMTELTGQSARRYRDRFDAGLLMMVCAVLALAGAFTSFGDRRGRVLTLLLTLLCLALSLTAAYLLYRIGRGISWSAAVTALIAAAELVFLIPSLLPSARGAGLSPGGSVQKGKTGTKSAENPDKKKK